MALEFTAGLMAGASGVLAGHPLDTVKVRLQTQSMMKAEPGSMYRGMIHCLRSIVKEEGTAALFKGISSPLAGLAFVNAIVFSVHGQIIKRLDPTAPFNHFISGSIAGLSQSIVTSPMELVKTRIQVQGQHHPYKSHWFFFDHHTEVDIYRNPYDCLKKIWKTEGLRGVFRGYTATVIRDFPSLGLYFYVYARMTSYYSPQGPQYLRPEQLLSAGGIAGVASWLPTYPLDVIKSRIQADGMEPNSSKYNGFFDCAKKTFKEVGLRGMSDGLSSAVTRAFITNAVTFFVVEWCFRIYERYYFPRYEARMKNQQVMDPEAQRSTFFLPLPEAGSTFQDPNIKSLKYAQL